MTILVDDTDYRSADGMGDRVVKVVRHRSTLYCWCFTGGLLLGFLGLIWYYVRGLMGAPQELYLLYFTR